MLEYDRKQQIINYLEGVSGAKISELAKLLYTSESTVRRDLIALEEAGIVKRVHGGAILSRDQKEIIPYKLRESANASAKEVIAQRAARLVHSGDTIMLDSSSTAQRICKYVKNLKNLTVITNNFRIFQEFRGSDVSVFCAGGNYSMQSDCFVGFYAEAFLRNFNADLCFFSSSGLSEDGYATGKSPLDLAVKTTLIKQSEKSYLVIDSSKLNTKFSFITCHVNDLAGVICDKPLPEFQRK